MEDVNLKTEVLFRFEICGRFWRKIFSSVTQEITDKLFYCFPVLWLNFSDLMTTSTCLYKVLNIYFFQTINLCYQELSDDYQWANFYRILERCTSANIIHLSHNTIVDMGRISFPRLVVVLKLSTCIETRGNHIFTMMHLSCSWCLFVGNMIT